MTRLVPFLVVAAGLAGAAFWVYLRAELPVGARLPLAALRAAALVLLLALFLDLRLPWGRGDGDGPRWALLDVSASMTAGGGAAWKRARARATELEAAGWTVVPFAAGVGPVESPNGEPRGLHTLLAPALARAVEAGAREIRVLSDLRFEDPVEAAAAVGAAASPISFEGFGGALANAGLSGLVIHDPRRRGDPPEAEVELFAEGAADSVQVEIREEGVLVLARAVAAPSPGRRARVRFSLPPPRGEGRLRYTADVTLPGDGFPSDDEAVAYVMAGREEGGLVLVSLRPDWEPRALLGVLGDATGLAATGYLRAGPDRFLPMGRAVQRGAARDSASVREAAQDAAILVLHGLSARSEAWSTSLARRASRVLLWPADSVGAYVAGVATGLPQGGEWYAVPEVRPSPLGAALAGAALRDLPPLTDVLPLSGPQAVAPPLEVQPGGIGPGRPALILQDSPGGRSAVVLASGFWRWAARDGAPRDAYRRLWSGVAGWLLADDPSRAATQVRPERWVVPAGTPLGWWIPRGDTVPVRLRILGAAGAPALDTSFASPAGAATAPLPPGTYRYRAGRGEEALGEGRFDVEARSEEMLPPPRVPELHAPASPEASVGEGRSGPAGPPLRRGAWPYLLVLLLLSAEWVGRRRAGLR